MFFLNYSTIIDPLLKDIRLYTPEFSGMKTGDSVLDVCCGTGEQVFHYVKTGIIASGIDLDPGMLAIAERNKIRQGISDISFRLADAVAIPFENDSFDFASICFGLHDKKREARDRVIAEMKRVVKRQGSLIFIDFQVPLPNNLYGYLAKSIEFIVGGTHYEGFRDYLKQGGLDEILTKHHLVEEKRNYLKSGLIVMIKAKNTI